MSDIVSDERREIVRAILTQAQVEIDLALTRLDTYDKPHFLEIERAAGGLINFFPENDRNKSCY
ncbi:hypothetical protein [Trujillonella humicola]|uniref:hypothetical protein n=1 Tax=Trujillonella humicola TaxID=3383699 RepID=UPI0039064709